MFGRFLRLSSLSGVTFGVPRHYGLYSAYHLTIHALSPFINHIGAKSADIYRAVITRASASSLCLGPEIIFSLATSFYHLYVTVLEFALDDTEGVLVVANFIVVLDVDRVLIFNPNLRLLLFVDVWEVV